MGVGACDQVVATKRRRDGQTSFPLATLQGGSTSTQSKRWVGSTFPLNNNGRRRLRKKQASHEGGRSWGFLLLATTIIFILPGTLHDKAPTQLQVIRMLHLMRDNRLQRLSWVYSRVWPQDCDTHIAHRKAAGFPLLATFFSDVARRVGTPK